MAIKKARERGKSRSLEHEMPRTPGWEKKERMYMEDRRPRKAKLLLKKDITGGLSCNYQGFL